MKKLASLAALFVFLAGSAAFAQSASMPSLAGDLLALEKLNATWLNAYTTRDVAAVDSVLADEFEAIYPGEQVRKKADILKGMTNPANSITSIRWDNLKILVFGDVALVRGITHVAGTNPQGPFTSANDYADVYVKRAGTWRAVSAHVVRVQE
ncbi:nuclear transport factor 2 family protein [Roseiterribacter gracilis]|uniref:DUF4440 domain-containing protein n=1 Tax=Roseiterribacter gracilis TaxID=2812848 RepID=A0A8S8XAV8_9PROT|nr:hypothetical protein TMPK1_06820 [Rhodospirillales bacterium TMPK1]